MQPQKCGQLVGIADAVVDIAAQSRPFYPPTGELFQLVIDIKGVYDASFAHLLQSLSHTEGAVSRERTHLQDVPWAYHGDQHLEQSALNMAAHHAPVERMQVGGTPKSVQIVALWVAVLLDVALQFFRHTSLYSSFSCSRCLAAALPRKLSTASR